MNCDFVNIFLIHFAEEIKHLHTPFQELTQKYNKKKHKTHEIIT